MPVTLLKSDSNADVFLWIMHNFQEQLLCKRSANRCFFWVVINHTRPKKGHTHTHIHTQPKKCCTHPHLATPSPKKVTLTHTHPHPVKKKSHSNTQPKKHHNHPHLAKKDHTYPDPPTSSQKKGHTHPLPPTPSQKGSYPPKSSSKSMEKKIPSLPIT